MPSVKDVNCLTDVAAGNADIGEHAVIQPVERFGRGVAALPLADRLEDVLHGYGFLVLSAAIAPKSSMAGLVVAGFGLCCVAAYVDIPTARRIAKAAHQACERVMAGLTGGRVGERSKTARIQGASRGVRAAATARDSPRGTRVPARF